MPGSSEQWAALASQYERLVDHVSPSRQQACVNPGTSRPPRRSAAGPPAGGAPDGGRIRTAEQAQQRELVS